MSETAIGGVPEHCNAKIRQLFDKWLSIRPATGLPGRRHFDPVYVPLLLPNIYLLDAPTASADFMFRLMGTRIEYFFGGNFTGQPFVNAYRKSRQSQAYIDVSAIVQDRLPRWRRGPASFVENREHVVTERVYLPLADDGATVNMILGILVAKIGDTEFV